MNRLALVLRVLAPVFFIVAALHIFLGLQADRLLGANVPPSAAADPSLDSQNRFYGAALTLYGLVLLLCAADLRRNAAFFKAALAAFFLGGLARLVSWAAHGPPAPLVIALAVSELVLPPVLWLWYRSVQNAA